jgi:hypothetical protein
MKPSLQSLLMGLLCSALLACSPRPVPLVESGVPALQAPADPLIEFLARREWLSFAQAVRAPALNLPAAELACLDQLQPDEFIPVMQGVVGAQFSADEQATARAFLASPAGQQLSAAVLATLNGQAQAMAQMQQAMGAADLQAQARFTQTAVGLQIVGGLGPKARAHCGRGQPLCAALPGRGDGGLSALKRWSTA